MSKTNRLSMLDEFGVRQRIIPAEVDGWNRKWRVRVHVVLLLIFLALPWIRVGETQAVLLDIVHRRFEIFGQVFMSHDSPILFFLLALFALGLIFTTAVWGRVWCGWACPQTVFIDSVYRRIEIWAEGTYIERRRLAQLPWSERFSKQFAKWLGFLLVSSLIAHSFIAYFTGGRELLQMISTSPKESWSYFLLVSFVTALLMFNFGWFREQFCIIMCPYGRFQSVLMDKFSKSVSYDHKRGEPRKGKALSGNEGGTGAVGGDCVSCNRCVEVCPTGIDIRDGLQMECIGCTACIDACNIIMKKMGRAPNLIFYGVDTPYTPVPFFRPRVMAYMALLGVLIIGLSYILAARAPFSVTILRASGIPYQMAAEDQVLNHFRAHILNQSHRRQKISFSLPLDLAHAGITLTRAADRDDLAPGESREVHLFLNLPKSAFNPSGSYPLHLHVHDSESGERRTFELTAVGPIREL